MKNFLNKLFKLEENQTTIKTEIIAGVTTFFAMCYIVIVNPNQMTGFEKGMQDVWNACFIGGLIAAVVATLLMAFVANKPFALAAGMGLNSFFFTSFIAPTLLLTSEFSPTQGYKAGLAIILMSGLVFLILSVTGLRKYLAKSLPQCLKTAIPAGIGLFIALIGLKNGGVVVANPYTAVALVDFTLGASAAIPAIVTIVGFILVAIFSGSKVKFLKGGSIILGMLGATALYYVLALIFKLDINVTQTSIGQSFTDWANVGFLGAFEGFGLLFGEQIVGGIFSVIMLVITYCLVDLFDTLGTLYGASSEAGMLDENGDPEGLSQEMLCDSIGTAVGAVVGTSTITTFVESSAGVAAGGRTGLTAFVTSILFALCLFVAPIAQYIPQCATAPALIFVGVLMTKNILNIDFTDMRCAATGFITFIIMITTYSISNGIMFGAATYVLITLFTGKYTKADIVITIIAVLGILRFAFVTI